MPSPYGWVRHSHPDISNCYSVFLSCYKDGIGVQVQRDSIPFMHRTTPVHFFKKNNMKKYCLGFLFDNGRDQICLIRKNNPEWQTGLFNGIGGSLESKETAVHSMVRHFKNKAGVNTNEDQWNHFARVASLSWQIDCFSCESDNSFYAARTMTDEPVEPHYIDELMNLSIVSNVLPLILLAVNNDIKFSTIKY